jgi:hypothetical protein
MKALKEEKDFRNYLKRLAVLSKKYTVIIAVKDTPGNCITEEIAAEIMAMGFEKI